MKQFNLISKNILAQMAVVFCLVITAVLLILFLHPFSTAHAHKLTNSAVSMVTAPIYYHDRVVVLMFHNVSPHLKGRGTITPEQFNSDLVALQEKGFKVISVKNTADFLNGRGSVPQNAVVLTFDDGYSGMYDYVLPILKKHKNPAL